jgi:hypothetical protein
VTEQYGNNPKYTQAGEAAYAAALGQGGFQNSKTPNEGDPSPKLKSAANLIDLDSDPTKTFRRCARLSVPV